MRRGRFEANDALSALHAPIAIALVLFGCAGPAGAAREIAFGAGAGMTPFGLAYLVVHDGLVHERLPVPWLARVPYLRAVARAHRVHHAGALGGPPFGLFLGPIEIALHRRRVTPRSKSSAPRRGPTSPRSTARDRA